MPNKHGTERGCGAEALGLLKIGPDTTRRYDRRPCADVEAFDPSGCTHASFSLSSLKRHEPR
jgi:hypothetical protein